MPGKCRRCGIMVDIDKTICPDCKVVEEEQLWTDRERWLDEERDWRMVTDKERGKNGR